MYLIHFKDGRFECRYSRIFFFMFVNMNKWALW